MRGFKEIPASTLTNNVFELIGKDWMLITSGTKDSFNTMTASWGGLGVLWNKNVAFTFVRPNRYTYEFMEDNDYYTLSFYKKEHKEALTYCGTHSGRDANKVEEIGFTPAFDKNCVYFEEAWLVLICKKIYTRTLSPINFLDEEIGKNYPLEDYHKVYVGEIVKVLQRDI